MFRTLFRTQRVAARWVRFLAIPPPPAPNTVPPPRSRTAFDIDAYRRTAPVDVPLPAEEYQTPDNLFTFQCPLCFDKVNIENYVNHVWTGHGRHDDVEREFLKVLMKERKHQYNVRLRKGTGHQTPEPRPATERRFVCRYCGCQCATPDIVFKHIAEAHPTVDLDNEPQPAAAPSATSKDFAFDLPLDRSMESLSRVVCPLCPPGSLRIDINEWMAHVGSTKDAAHENCCKEHCRKLVRQRKAEIRAASQQADEPRSETIRQVYPTVTNRAAHLGAAEGFPCKHCGPDKNNAFFLHRSVAAYFEHVRTTHPAVDLSAEGLPQLVERMTSVTPQVFSPVVFGPSKFPCEICHRVLHTELSLITHLDTQHAQQIHLFPMQETESAFPMYETIGASAWHGKNDAPYVPTGRPISVSCPLCAGGKKRIFTSEPALLAHLQTKHANLTNPMQTLRDIMNQKEAPRSFRCTVCLRECGNADALEQHVRAKHGRSSHDAPSAEACQWWCPHCDKGFSTGAALHNHATFKHGLLVESLPCPACRRTFPHQFGLHEHVVANHRHLDARPFACEGVPCPSCPDKVFLNETERDIHVATFHIGAAR